jgi:hypothetical protein
LSTETTISINTRVTIDGRPVQITVRTGATVDDCRRIMGVMQEVLAEHPDTPTLVASISVRAKMRMAATASRKQREKMSD